MGPRIEEIEVTAFRYPLADVGRDPKGFNLVYDPGNTFRRLTYGVRIRTDAGVTGEYVGGTQPGMAQVDLVADYLLGRDALHRERHWTELRRALRAYDRTGIGPLDVALWDLAGKHCGVPVHELLGTYRTSLPAYVSTYFGAEDDGFDSPAAYADYAETCLELGYPAFKTHVWSGVDDRDVDREVAVVDAVGDRVGDEMALMHDPVCQYETFGDALRVGRACDDHDYFWYEDPYSDTGASHHGHRKLRQLLDTPLLQTELVRGLEAHANFVIAEATDFVRADVEWDGGITGAMKIARMAESLGLDVEYHLPGPAQRHCMAATRNSNFYELGLVHPDASTPHTQPPVYASDYTDRVDAVDADGTFPVPDGPGLGVDYDWSYVEEHAVNRTLYS